MAKVFGPLFSIYARGSIKYAITFSKNKAGDLATKYRIRKYRLTTQQKLFRYFARLKTRWTI